MKMNKHYNELKASYLFVDIAHNIRFSKILNESSFKRMNFL